MPESIQDQARTVLLQLEKERPECIIDWQDQPAQGECGAIYFGRFEGRPAAFKYFSDASMRENEERALRHFAPHGLAPACLASLSDRLLVIEKVAGGPMHINSEEELQSKMALWVATCADLGGRLQRMSALPAPASDLMPYDPNAEEHNTWLRHSPEEFVSGSMKKFAGFAAERGLDLGVFQHYLDRPLAALPLLKRQAACWNYWDINTGNMLEHDGLFQGLVDFGGCRLGTWIQQLGSALWAFRRMPKPWRSLYESFTAGMGRQLSPEEQEAVLAMAYVEGWWFQRRFPVDAAGKLVMNGQPFAEWAKMHFDWCDERIKEVNPSTEDA
jgi:hypothetical protein